MRFSEVKQVSPLTTLCCALLLLGIVVATQAALADRGPLSEPDAPDFYQRVLTLPGAVLYQQPGGAAIGTPPVFSVMYVYDRLEFTGDSWVQVGRDDLGATGFLRKQDTETWPHMLVMRFAPRGARSRVLFFRDRATLHDLTRSMQNAEIVEELYQGVRYGAPDREILVAVEPATAVKYVDQPYLLPILGHVDVRVGGRRWTTLVNVAGLTATTKADPGDNFDEAGSGALQPSMQDFRIGVVFVVDTTRSMRPYIDQIFRVVSRTYMAFRDAGELDNVSFGVVGFRDNVAPNPRIGYVSQTIHPLDPSAAPESVLDSLSGVEVAPVPTQGWNEDAFAGVHHALTKLEWDDFDARLIVLVTDAGPRSGSDPLASTPQLDIASLAQLAKEKNVALFPVHLHTEEAAALGNIALAEVQYRALGLSGDLNTQKYIGVPAQPVALFSAKLGEYATTLVSTAKNAARGRAITASAVADDRAATVEEMVLNEIFRAQLEYLGEQADTKAPRFFRAWASDHDLLHSDRQSLEVAVFLTRNQLSALAKQLRRIVETAMAGESSSKAFFGRLQTLAAETSYDPQAVNWTTEGALGESGLLPAYLARLPYYSDVLNLTEPVWLSLGQSGQQDFIENLAFKLRAYHEIGISDQWVSLDTEDAANEFFAVPLSLLP